MLSFLTDFSNSADTGLRPGGLDVGGLIIPLAGMGALLLYTTYKLARRLRDSDGGNNKILIKVEWTLLPPSEKGTI